MYVWPKHTDSHWNIMMDYGAIDVPGSAAARISVYALFQYVHELSYSDGSRSFCRKGKKKELKQGSRRIMTHRSLKELSRSRRNIATCLSLRPFLLMHSAHHFAAAAISTAPKSRW